MEDQINEIQQKFNESLEVSKRESEEANQVNDNESSAIASNKENSNLEETMNNQNSATDPTAPSLESKSSSFEEVTSGSSNQDVDMLPTEAKSNTENKQTQQVNLRII